MRHGNVTGAPRPRLRGRNARRIRDSLRLFEVLTQFFAKPQPGPREPCFHAVALKFRISDVSLIEYSSMSRRTNTISALTSAVERADENLAKSVARYCASGFGARSATSFSYLGTWYTVR